MDAKSTRKERREEIARELGSMIRRQARRRWSAVRTAERNERGHHVWRFRAEGGTVDRFLHISNEAMDRASASGRALFGQLRAAGWLDRLEEGPANAIRLSPGGQLEPWPAG